MKRYLILGLFLGLAHRAHADGTVVEDKVVEIHMSVTESADAAPEKSNKKNKKTLPLRAGTCSGAFVSDSGDILTAKHCVTGFDTFEVKTRDSRVYVATVVSSSTAHDLALIHIDLSNTPYFVVAKGTYRAQPIAVLGSPLGITDVLTVGLVAKIQGDRILLDCSALPGNSGGPVINADGEMMGVLVAGYIVMMGTTGLTIAEGVDAIRFFLKGALK